MKKKIALIVSKFNQQITVPLRQGALDRLHESGIEPSEIMICEVPGAVEISLMAQQYAKTGDYAAIIACGCVIRGETSHYDYVCQMVASGLNTVALKYDLPVVLGVLMTENLSQALERVGGLHGHKGRDAAETALFMIQCLENHRESADHVIK